jgi:hypothetical protein
MPLYSSYISQSHRKLCHQPQGGENKWGGKGPGVTLVEPPSWGKPAEQGKAFPIHRKEKDMVASESHRWTSPCFHHCVIWCVISP